MCYFSPWAAIPAPSHEHGFRYRPSLGSPAWQPSVTTTDTAHKQSRLSTYFSFLSFFFSGLQLKYTLFPRGSLAGPSTPRGEMGAHRNNVSNDVQPSLEGSGCGYSSSGSLPHRVLARWVWREVAPHISVHFGPLLSSSGLFCHSFPHVCKVGLDEIQLFK